MAHRWTSSSLLCAPFGNTGHWLYWFYWTVYSGNVVTDIHHGTFEFDQIFLSPDHPHNDHSIARTFSQYAIFIQYTQKTSSRMDRMSMAIWYQYASTLQIPPIHHSSYHSLFLSHRLSFLEDSFW